MCEICGCSDGADVKVINLKAGETLDPASKHHHGDSHHHAHSHDHEHSHDHDHDRLHHQQGVHHSKNHHGRDVTVLL